MTIKLNYAAIEQLKKSQWEEVENGRKITSDFSTNLLWEITGLNADILNARIENAYYEATYERTENGENEYSYNLCIGYLTENHDTIFSCNTDDSDTDFLELFTEKEPEKTDEQIKWEQFNDYLSGFIGENDDAEIIEQIKQNLTSFWNKIVEDVVENLSTDDIEENEQLYDALLDNIQVNNLPEYKILDIVDDYIDDNPGEVFEKAADRCDSSDVRDFIVNYLNNNL